MKPTPGIGTRCAPYLETSAQKTASPGNARRQNRGSQTHVDENGGYHVLRGALTFRSASAA